MFIGVLKSIILFLSLTYKQGQKLYASSDVHYPGLVGPQSIFTYDEKRMWIETRKQTKICTNQTQHKKEFKVYIGWCSILSRKHSVEEEDG